MITCVDWDDLGNNLRVIFQFSWQLQADPNHPLLIWKRVPGRRLRRHSEQANGSKGGDASQDLRPLCLQELEEGAYRHGELNHVATPSLSLWKEEVVYVDNFFWCLVVDFVPWRQLRRRDWKWEDERFELQEAMSRWLFNFHHHFYDDECNGEMSMNMIVRMKVFQLKCKKEN